MQYNNLEDEHTLVVLAYADAGLGHLRVTNSLFEGLSKEKNPVLLRSKEGAIQNVHGITSRRFFRKFLEWTQRGKQEQLITSIYIKLLKFGAKDAQKKLEEILEQQMHVAQKLVLVATHFGLAHQLAAIKEQVEHKWNIKVYLAVCVTDDSPQPIWFVPGADIIFLPSLKTRKALKTYRKKKRYKKVRLKVIPYPVSPLLGQKLKVQEFEQKGRQLNPKAKDIINVSLPVSGAAVGLEFAEVVMSTLHKKNPRYVFNIVTHDNVFTNSFIEKNRHRQFATVLESSHPRRVVRLYDKLFMNSIVSLEITKPSEQAFKALFNPKQRGGVVLLFTHPVGRQEYDNLHYLRRNRLLPSVVEHERLYLYAKEKAEFSETVKERLSNKAKSWRALQLPDDPKEAANFIEWCLQNNIFKGMGHSAKQNSDGVERFWKEVNRLIL